MLQIPTFIFTALNSQFTQKHLHILYIHAVNTPHFAPRPDSQQQMPYLLPTNEM